jgi:hypothetical protein
VKPATVLVMIHAGAPAVLMTPAGRHVKNIHTAQHARTRVISRVITPAGAHASNSPVLIRVNLRA